MLDHLAPAAQHEDPRDGEGGARAAARGGALALHEVGHGHRVERADGPEREPYVCYLQGGTSRMHVELAAMSALQALRKSECYQ